MDQDNQDIPPPITSVSEGSNDSSISALQSEVAHLKDCIHNIHQQTIPPPAQAYFTWTIRCVEFFYSTWCYIENKTIRSIFLLNFFRTDSTSNDVKSQWWDNDRRWSSLTSFYPIICSVPSQIISLKSLFSVDSKDINWLSRDQILWEN